MKSLLTLAAVTLFSSAIMATAGIVQYNITDVDTVSHDFRLGMQWPPEEQMPPEPDIVTDHLGSSLGLPTLTGNFAIDKTFEITVSAPEGQQFVYSPLGDIGNTFNMTLRSIWSSQMPYLSPTSFSFQWLGATGVTPEVGNYDTSFTPGARFMVVLGAPITEAFSFTGFKVTMTVPDEFNNSYENFALGELDLNFQSSMSAGGNDPGQTLQTESVPEPSTFALVGMSLTVAGGLAFRRRK